MAERKIDILSALKIVMNDAWDICEKDKNVKSVIGDTVTRLDKFLNNHWFSPKNIPKNWQGDDDNQQAFMRIFRNHHEFQSAMITLPVQPIFCFHPMVIKELTQGKDNVRKEAKASKSILTMGDTTKIVGPEITGKSKNVYLADAALELYCRSFRSPSTGQWKYTVHPNGYNDARGKNRLRGILEDTEEANLRVLLNKVQQAFEAPAT